MRYTVRLIVMLLFCASAASAQWRPVQPYNMRYYGLRADSLLIDGPGRFSMPVTVAAATANEHAITRGQADTSYLRKKFSQIFPYDSVYYAPRSKIYSGISNDFEIFNLGNFARNTIPFQQTPIGIGRGNWSGLFTNNMTIDTLAGPGWKVWNTSYPASCIEVGWEGVTFHYVPSGHPSFTEYPHEGLQVRGGIDGIVAHDADSQYIQAKTTIVARFDTAFDAGSTAYGWGYSRKPFTWFYSDYPTKQLGGNIYSSFDQYYTGTTSGPISAFMRSRGSYLAKSAVQTGDTLGGIGWYGYDGGQFLNNIRMYGVATANATSNNSPAKWTVSVGNGASDGGSITATATGNAGINNTNPQSVLHIVRQDFGGVIYLDRYDNTGTQLSPGFFGIASRGTISAPAAVQDGDPLVSVAGGGFDGTLLDRDARGRATISADGDWTSGNKPTRFDLVLTHTIDDAGPMLSVDRSGNTGIGGTEDPNFKATIHGIMKASANSYTTGGHAVIVRNSVTGAFERIDSSTFYNSIVRNQTSVVQTGAFRLNGSSFIVGASTTAINIGQTGGTSSFSAGINLDAVNGDFAGLDYAEFRQTQDGNARMRNNNSSGNLVLGAGGSTAANITLTTGNVTTFGGSLQMPAPVATTGNITLTSAHYAIRITNSAHAVTIPAANTCQGRVYVLINYNTGGNVTISSVNRDGVAITSLPNNAKWTIQSDGTNWYVIQD